MKWMIASDIHGSAFYCQQLLERYREEGADRLLLLGDLLYHGPRNDLPAEYAPKKVISMLNAHKDEIFCVRGNCEAEVDQMVLEFPVLADYALLSFGDRMVFATHGHLFSEAHLPPLRQGSLFLYGHTHIPVCHTCGEIVCMNPGSVSIPKEGSEHSYMVFADGEFLWKRLPDGEEYRRYRL